LIFGHFALAAVGLVVWILYVITDTTALAWTAFVLLVPVAFGLCHAGALDTDVQGSLQGHPQFRG
jgi:uncharacterized membrane protein YeiB